QHMPELTIADEVVIADFATQPHELLADGLAVGACHIAAQLAAAGQIAHELLPTGLPGPFLELEAQAVELFVEEPLRIDIAGHQRANFGGHEQAGQLMRIEDAPRRGAAGEPAEILWFKNEQGFAIDLGQQGGDLRLVGVDVGTTLGRGRAFFFLRLNYLFRRGAHRVLLWDTARPRWNSGARLLAGCIVPE